jgi:HAMP domain-containing protein
MVSVKMARLRTNLDKNRLHHDSPADALGYLGLLNQAYNDLPFPRTVAER